MAIISCVQTKHRDAQNVTLLQVFARDVKDFMAFYQAMFVSVRMDYLE